MKRSVSCSRIPKDTRNPEGGKESFSSLQALCVHVGTVSAGSGRIVLALRLGEGCVFEWRIDQKFKVLRIHPLTLRTRSAWDFRTSQAWGDGGHC